MSRPKAKRSQRFEPDLHLVQDRPTSIPPTPLKPKTPAQGRLLSSLKVNALTICSGSAGAGKTYVSLSYAAELLRGNQIERLVITRPLVGTEAEERVIGALPNDLSAKLAPWVLPMTDILEERLGRSFFQYLLKVDRIRVSPLAYMRGSSFKDSFVFMTEAQNTTPTQMKMFLSRVGEGSKVCVDGDPRQSDLSAANGLEDAIARLGDLAGVGLVRFESSDIVRSGLCRAIVERYEQ